MNDLFILFSLQSVILLAGAALLVGISKTALPGIVTLPVAVFAAVPPAKESTAALLLLLIFGDVFAVLTYRQHTQWRALLGLAPTVLFGLAIGAVFLTLADNSGVRRAIGAILLVVVAFALWQRRSARDSPAKEPGALRYFYGTLGGFTTMVANAGGPVMSMYFLAARFPVKEFLGTAAWFFAIINLSKVPVSVGLGLFAKRCSGSTYSSSHSLPSARSLANGLSSAFSRVSSTGS